MTPRSEGGPVKKPIEVEEFADRFIHRPLAALLVPLLAWSPLTPNQVTLLSGAIGVAAGAAIAVGAERPLARLFGGLLLFASVVLDCCDGQLARLRGTSSTTGAVLDGLADYAVGIAYGLGATSLLVHHYGSGWYWLLGLAGMASQAVQTALFDHTKTRYIAQVGGGYAEREEDLEKVARARADARAASRRGEDLLLALYERYTRAQKATVRIAPASDPAAHRAANSRRMYVWTLLGSGTRFALSYALALLSFFWLPALTLFFVLNLTAFNVFLAVMLVLERRRAIA